MTLRRLVVLALLATAPQPAFAHDFWIALDHWHLPEDGEIKADFRVGTATEQERWQLRPERVVAFRIFAPDRAVADRTASLVAPGTEGWYDAMMTVSGVGTHLLAFETTPATSDLEAGPFDDYVAHEGLGAVAAHRAALKAPAPNGRELYARRAKALIQVGHQCSPQALQPIGLSLEIVPLVNPHCSKGDAMPVEVRFRGKPLADALVRMENLTEPDGEIGQRTDADGRTSFAMPKSGNWKISVVWSVPIEDNPQADYDTLFSSLSFGF